MTGQTTVASVFVLDLQSGEEINILSDVALYCRQHHKGRHPPRLLPFFESGTQP